MQDDVGKDKVSESPFRCNAEELVLVLGVRLEAQADWKGNGELAIRCGRDLVTVIFTSKDEAADGGNESGEE